MLCNGDHNLRHLLDGSAPNAAPRQVRRVEEYIEANWPKPFRIEDMAAIAGSSIRSIYRAFRNFRGYSPMEFVKQKRPARANNLLRDPNFLITVTQAAFARGFSDVSRFSKDFSEACGEPPSAVRDRSKKRVECGCNCSIRPAGAALRFSRTPGARTSSIFAAAIGLGVRRLVR